MDHIGQNELIQLPNSIYVHSKECVKIIKVYTFEPWVKILQTSPNVAKQA